MRQVLTSVLEPLADDLSEASEPTEAVQESQAGAWILSSWTLAHVGCEQVRTLLRGAWSHQRLQACQSACLRYVRSRQRKRGHRETEQRAWLHYRDSLSAPASGA